ncbi:MAG: type II toxin-antitoxin system VapC family toxin [Acidobacteria bacterium]|nr:type II toxin-antitoxin system VapC family toxin [Acidobacteriota bacterium]
MPDAVTDTHGLIWYLENDPRLGPDASLVFSACDQGQAWIYVPTVCLVEIVYLQEKGRIPANLKAIFDAKLKAGRSRVKLADLTAEVVDAMAQIPRSEVPDMPDRIIAATSLHLGLPLISKDRRIRSSIVTTIW